MRTEDRCHADGTKHNALRVVYKLALVVTRGID